MDKGKSKFEISISKSDRVEDITQNIYSLKVGVPFSTGPGCSSCYDGYQFAFWTAAAMSARVLLLDLISAVTQTARKHNRDSKLQTQPDASSSSRRQ